MVWEHSDAPYEPYASLPSEATKSLSPLPGSGARPDTITPCRGLRPDAPRGGWKMGLGDVFLCLPDLAETTISPSGSSR